jgi:pyruvate dehydrogenase E1 component
MPAMPPGVREGILKGMYRLKSSSNPEAKLRAQLFGSGPILNEVLQAQKLLENYEVAADVWSITSYKELYLEGHAVERWNMLHPLEEPRVPYVKQCLKDAPGVFVTASDYLKVLPDSIYRWFPRPVVSLGTDGFGRSDGRRALRNFFEVDARFVVLATLATLAREKKIEATLVQQAIKDLDIDPEKTNPVTS